MQSYGENECIHNLKRICDINHNALLRSNKYCEAFVRHWPQVLKCCNIFNEKFTHRKDLFESEGHNRGLVMFVEPETDFQINRFIFKESPFASNFNGLCVPYQTIIDDKIHNNFVIALNPKLLLNPFEGPHNLLLDTLMHELTHAVMIIEGYEKSQFIARYGGHHRRFCRYLWEASKYFLLYENMVVAFKGAGPVYNSNNKNNVTVQYTPNEKTQNGWSIVEDYIFEWEWYQRFIGYKVFDSTIHLTY